MKRIITIISFAAALLAAVSCVEPLNPTLPCHDLTLSFSCEVMTKADPDRLAVDNEDLVKQIDYFIFPLNEDGGVDDAAEYVYSGKLVPEDEGLGGLDLIYQVIIGRNLFTTVFPDGATKMMLFAVANYVDEFGTAVSSPNMTIPATAKTWKQLHDLKVGETFFYDDQNPNFQLRWPRRMTPDDDRLFFVMTGEKVIEMTAEPNVIPLERLASKVTVQYTFVKTVYDAASGITWVSDYEGSQVRTYLSNAIEHTTLGAPYTSETNLVGDSWGTATMPLGNGTRDIFEYAYDFLNPASDYGVNNTTTFTPVGNDNNKVLADRVFHYYTYPIDLDEGDDNQPYLKLVLPWYGYKNYTDAAHPGTLYKQKEVYYKIALPRTGVKRPNRIYEYNATVDIVDNEKEVEITGNYKVKDWLFNDAISANVAAGRYISLDIPKDEYNMYTDKLDITFVSSGTVQAKVIEIYQENYSQPTMSRDYFIQNDVVTVSSTVRAAKGNLTDAEIKGWVTIPNETSYLEINHAMDNRMTINNQKNNAFDMAPYVYKVRLHLEEADDDSFDRIITITQYPPMYVTSRKSNGYVFVNDYGYYTAEAYDDGTGSSRQGLGSVHLNPGSLTGTGSNDNPNNYIISVSILSDGSYIIGDPRSKDVDNLTNLNGLSNYRPTGREGTQNIVAPKFMVASSYGRMTSTTYFNLQSAEKRCASYQENGYPAGRWRVPTYAEIEFMVTLSRMSFIPSLYNFSNNDTTGYWSANGKVVGNASGLPELNTAYNNINTAVRCVYDAWYWGEEPVQENAQNWLGFYDN